MLLTRILTHPTRHFSGDYISALKGCCALKFIHALHQGYLAHTRIARGPQKAESWKFKIWLKIQRVRVNNFGINGSIMIHDIFIQTTCRKLQLQLSTLIANISSTDPQIENEKKVSDQLQPILRWPKKIGELWSTNKKVIDLHIDPP